MNNQHSIKFYIVLSNGYPSQEGYDNVYDAIKYCELCSTDKINSWN